MLALPEPRLSFRALILPVLLLAWPLPVRAEDRALFVGVSVNNPPLRSLPGIDLDLANMNEVALHMGFKPGQIKVLLGAEATKANIVAGISDWLTKGVGPNDRALFYYSGHGARVTDLNGDEADGLDEALCPADLVKNPSAGQIPYDNLLIDDEFGPLLDRVPAKEVIALIDACHSGSLSRASGFDAVPKIAHLGVDIPAERLGKSPEAGAVVDGEFSKSLESHLIMIEAANETQSAQATSKGSVFTLGLKEAVDAAFRAGHPLSANDVRGLTDGFIANFFAAKPQLAHTPVVDGNPKLATINLFGPPGAGGPAAAGPAPAPASSSGPAWALLEEIVPKAKYKLTVTPGRATYREGENLSLKIEIPQDGYLNVLNAGAGEDRPVVLFPNEFRPDNAVKAGTVVEIPGPGAPFALPAGLPPGVTEQKTVVIVLLTKAPLNAFQSTSGKGILRELSPAATRSFKVVAANPPAGTPDANGFGVGEFVVVIRK